MGSGRYAMHAAFSTPSWSSVKVLLSLLKRFSTKRFAREKTVEESRSKSRRLKCLRSACVRFE